MSLRVVLALLAAGTVGAAALRGAEGAAAAPGYVIRLFNIDDYATAEVNGRHALSCAYRQTCAEAIDAYLRRGANRIVIRFGNRSSGYTWGYELRQGKRRLAGASCGRVRKQSCGPGEPMGIYKVVQRDLVVP